MDLGKLGSDNSATVSEYVRKKYGAMNHWWYPSSSRESKAIEYWIASQGTPHGREALELVYQDVFKQLFPREKAKAAERKRASSPAKVESSQWIKQKQTHLTNLQACLADLLEWKDQQEYQGGETFLATLRTRVEFLDEELCDSTHFATEFGALCKAESTASSSATATSREAKFDLMVGFEQNASITFDAFSPNWGELNGKLEESFKAGAWANGGAKAEMTKYGISAEVQAAIAIGAQLKVEGELAWTKGKAGLTLGGEAEVFAGARASAEAKLSASVKEGLSASFKAGAFAGFSAEVKGTCSFTYDGQDIAKVEATAGVTFGAGATFEASLAAPIFGPSKIAFEASLTLGLGTKTGCEVEIDFTEAGLAASQEFRKLAYCRTLAKGYQLDLINSDARNLHYLKKSIHRVEAEIVSVEEMVQSLQRMPTERQPLLMSS